MKIKSIVSKRNEWIILAAVMFVKSLFVLPLFENIYSVIIGNMKFSAMLDGVAVAAGILIFSVIYSCLLVKLASKAGEYSAIFLIFAAADPLITVTVQNIFHAIAVIITVIWIGVSLKIGNKIAVAAVSVVSSAVISFIMPCAVFTFVPLGILVVLITASGKAASKAVSVVAAVVSAALSGYFVNLSSGKLRLDSEFLKVFNRFGGNESHALSLVRFEYGFSVSEIFRQFRAVALVCLPFVIFMFYIAVRAVTYKDSSYTAAKSTVLGKVLTVAAVLVPFIGSALASAVCFGTGCITGFVFTPLMVIFSLALSGNKAVLKALDEVYCFIKRHPVVALAAVIWMAANTMAFVTPNKVFSAALFSM